ncbi:hypothetical protein SLS60_006785 [Paraconiothyrium brasiliense]|uniref:Uncharacterized protein n=1 Tax=Paraconiothyrium brasiliense TaxID=300254 RepID=A0ABR3R7J7_9PLEO
MSSMDENYQVHCANCAAAANSREMTFDNNIKSIEDKGDVLLIRDDDMTPGTIFQFPNHLVGTEEAKRMILTILVCQEPIAYLHDFLTEMLDGTGVTLEEHMLRIRNPVKTVRVNARTRDLDMSNFYHSVVRAATSDGTSSWIVDVSGAQYSIFKACLAERIYRKRHVVSTLAAYRSGTNKDIYEKMEDMKGNGPLLARIGWFAVDKVKTAVFQWRTKSGFSLSALMGKPEDIFVEGRKGLVEHIKVSLDNFAVEVRAKFSADIGRTVIYSQQESWKLGIGLGLHQDVTKMMEEISKKNRLY